MSIRSMLSLGLRYYFPKSTKTVENYIHTLYFYTLVVIYGAASVNSKSSDSMC